MLQIAKDITAITPVYNLTKHNTVTVTTNDSSNNTNNLQGNCSIATRDDALITMGKEWKARQRVVCHTVVWGISTPSHFFNDLPRATDMKDIVRTEHGIKGFQSFRAIGDDGREVREVAEDMGHEYLPVVRALGPK